MLAIPLEMPTPLCGERRIPLRLALRCGLFSASVVRQVSSLVALVMPLPVPRKTFCLCFRVRRLRSCERRFCFDAIVAALLVRKKEDREWFHLALAWGCTNPHHTMIPSVDQSNVVGARKRTGGIVTFDNRSHREERQTRDIIGVRVGSTSR